MKQDTIFSGGEGDKWFQRNQGALARTDLEKTDPVLRVLQIANLAPRRVVEIGASTGYRLHLLQKLHACEATAVEPSEAAIAEGRTMYPSINFISGVAAAVPVADDGGFDLVIVNAVLHWVDRTMLLRSCAELDRLLAPQGFLVVGDFLPASPERVTYHHRTDVQLYTYKQPYAEIFIATRLYTQFASLVFDHSGFACRPDLPPQDRYQVALLKKTGEEVYITREFQPHAL